MGAFPGVIRSILAAFPDLTPFSDATALYNQQEASSTATLRYTKLMDGPISVYEATELCQSRFLGVSPHDPTVSAVPAASSPEAMTPRCLEQLCPASSIMLLICWRHQGIVAVSYRKVPSLN